MSPLPCRRGALRPTNTWLEKEGSAVLPMQDLGVDPTIIPTRATIEVHLVFSEFSRFGSV